MSDSSKVDSPKESGSPKAEMDEPAHSIPEAMYNRLVRCDLKDGTAEVRVALLTLSKYFLDMYQISTSVGMPRSGIPTLNSTMNEDTELVCPVPEATKRTFKFVVDWLEAQILEQKQIDRCDIVADENGDRKPIPLNDFQKKFFDELDFESHAELLNISDFMDIQSLYILGTMTMADRIKVMSEQEIRDNFGLEDDLTEEQKDEIRRLNVWCHY